MTGSPAIFLPRISGSDMFWSSNAWLPISSDSDDRLALGVGKLDADHAAAGDGRDARRQRRHVAGDVVGELDHPAGLDPARRLELVHGDDRARADLDDVAADVEILEHRFEQARIALEPGAVDLLPALLGRRREQVERRQLVVVAEREARLGAGRLAVLAARPAARRLAPARRPRPSGATSAARRGSRARRAARSCAARRGVRAARGGTGRRSSPARRPSGRARNSRAPSPASANSSSVASRTGPAICGLADQRRTRNRRHAPRPARARRPSRRAGPTRPSRWSGRARCRAGRRRSRRSAARGRSGRPARSRIMRSPAIAMTGRNSAEPSPNSSSSASLE